MSTTAIATNEHYVTEEIAVNPMELLHPVYVNPFPGDAALFPLEKTLNIVLKRGIDLVIALLAIVLLVPLLFPLLALLIKCTSRGPVFFLQKRYKKNGALFTCIKFRTMETGTASDQGGARITALGRFLRRHHLDECPQFFNVLLGDMSLIGPRPHMISDTRTFEQLLTDYHFRHRVKPGITGWAQVHGYVGPVTSIENLKGRVEKDQEYIKRWSMRMDLKIAFKTLFQVVITTAQNNQ
jgi:putative colanic acid biosynthesis UDP-glucose lipid carrier transferase